MDTNLYVGGLSFSTTEDSLRDAFLQAGKVKSVAIIKDKITGKSRGFGFVDMETDEEAEAAISMWHEKEFEGRMLTVNKARPREEHPPRRGGFSPRGGGRDFQGGRGSSRW